jgi:hypothetical protein
MRGHKLAAFSAFLSVIAISVVSCIFDADVPPQPTPPKIPHPLWVFYDNYWYEYDQIGEKVYSKSSTSNVYRARLNPSTGDIWVCDLLESFSIYDATGEFRNTLIFDGYAYGPVFDTNEKLVWICHFSDWEESFLTALNYKGERLKTKRVPEPLYAIDVYEPEGEIWAVTFSVVYKFNKNGDPIFSKTVGELGYEYRVGELFVDQTDGGVWLVAKDAPHFLKLDRSGKPAQTINVSGRILDVGRKTGNVLANVEAESGVWYLGLFNKYASLLWRRGRSETGYRRGLIADFDGSCWYMRTRTGEKDKLVLGKLTEAGEHIVKDVVVGDSDHSASFAMWNDPYPYR